MKREDGMVFVTRSDRGYACVEWGTEVVWRTLKDEKEALSWADQANANAYFSRK